MMGEDTSGCVAHRPLPWHCFSGIKELCLGPAALGFAKGRCLNKESYVDGGSEGRGLLSTRETASAGLASGLQA